MEKNDELNKIGKLNCMCYYLDDIIKIEDLDIDILLDEKSYKNILITTFCTKLWHFVQNFDWCRTIRYYV